MSTAREQSISVEISQKASDLFGRKGFCPDYLGAFLEAFAVPRFAHICAFPRRADRAVMAARLTCSYKSEDDIYLKAEDIDFILQALRSPEHKQATERGDLVTKYPKLVEALIDAKRDMRLYDTTEMQAYLTRRFDGAAHNVAPPRTPKHQQQTHFRPADLRP